MLVVQMARSSFAFLSISAFTAFKTCQVPYGQTRINDIPTITELLDSRLNWKSSKGNCLNSGTIRRCKPGQFTILVAEALSSEKLGNQFGKIVARQHALIQRIYFCFAALFFFFFFGVALVVKRMILRHQKFRLMSFSCYVLLLNDTQKHSELHWNFSDRRIVSRAFEWVNSIESWNPTNITTVFSASWSSEVSFATLAKILFSQVVLQ